MDYLGMDNLNNIVNEYLIGDAIKYYNKSVSIEFADINKLHKVVNQLGADLFITKPDLFWLCHGNYVLLVKKYVQIFLSYNNKNAYDNHQIKKILNRGLNGACNGGHLNLIKYMIDHGANDLNSGLWHACQSNLKIVKYIIDFGVDPFYSFYGACCSGNLEIVKYFIAIVSKQKKIFNYYYYTSQACETSHLEIVKYMFKLRKSWSTDDINGLLHMACRCGQLEIAKYLVSRGANDFNGGLQFAVKYNKPNTAYYMTDMLGV